MSTTTTGSSFGELKLRSTSPPPLDESSPSEMEDSASSMSHHVTKTTNEDEHLTTIDLNGTGAPQSANSGGVNTSTSYTSFEGATTTSVTNPSPPPLVSARSTIYASTVAALSPSSSSNSSSIAPPSSSSNVSSPTSSPSGSGNNGLMATAGEVSARLAERTAHTLEHIRLWSKSAYKCTRQIVSEKLGKTGRTLDPEIELAAEVPILFTIFRVILYRDFFNSLSFAGLQAIERDTPQVREHTDADQLDEVAFPRSYALAAIDRREFRRPRSKVNRSHRRVHDERRDASSPSQTWRSTSR